MHGLGATQTIDYAQVALAILQYSGLCIANLDPELRLVEANNEFVHHVSGTSASLSGRSFLDFLNPGTQEQARRHFGRLASGQRSAFTDYLVGVSLQGGQFTGHLTAIANHSDTGRMSGVTVIVQPDGASAEPPRPVRKNRALNPLDARILEGIAAGASTIQLAAKLHLSRQGIEYRVSSLLRKHRVPNRAALVSRAYATGVLTIGAWPPSVRPEFIE
ncbi:PAS domain-containing protein [Streptomyces sp. NBRC 109706]|uniref:helix-turn-helix transcriptional regulator n=1 Tax=Streptomyces sp. NBRC 109706 TaxID=1550035 RepID=UPI00131D861D|nr:PAS domain-containing protein [Streptomyces sp. NBRC 109706]